jgi:hypothetical protein
MDKAKLWGREGIEGGGEARWQKASRLMSPAGHRPLRPHTHPQLDPVVHPLQFWRGRAGSRRLLADPLLSSLAPHPAARPSATSLLRCGRRSRELGKPVLGASMGRRGRWWEAGRAVCEEIRVQGEEESRAGWGEQARVRATTGESRSRARAVRGALLISGRSLGCPLAIEFGPASRCLVRASDCAVRAFLLFIHFLYLYGWSVLVTPALFTHP